MTKPVYFLPYEALDAFVTLLKQHYQVIGPTLKNEHIVYENIDSSEELPWGYISEQNLGSYALKQTKQKMVFAWVNSMSAIKPKVFKPKELLWTVERDNKGQLQFIPSKPKSKKMAFFGIRPCDLRGMLIQDKVLLNSHYEDEHYKTRRTDNFIIVANCSLSSNNCFCVAMGDDPKAESHFDIALTEIQGGLLFELGNDKAAFYAEQLTLNTATQEQIKAAEKAIAFAADSQTKKIKSKTLPKDLFANLDHPHWDNVAEQCLSCGNCTQVCPTCFCHNEIETPSLSGESSEHSREWGSCFTLEHSYIHGKTIRKDVKSRYRQWLTHKFGSWQQQFGTNGCVGCGRCMTWCPTGIDVTEVLNKVTEEDGHDS